MAGSAGTAKNSNDMRIGVLSDTHDHLGYLRRAVDALCDLQVELVLHAGDYVAPFVVNELQRLPCQVLGIFGNNKLIRLHHPSSTGTKGSNLSISAGRSF